MPTIKKLFFKGKHRQELSLKIILSRKGFDSSNGGMPSPIFPDGKIVSLPILASKSPTRLNDLNFNGYDIAEIVSEISRGRIKSQQYIHLDPDLDPQILPHRPQDWRGAFGQAGAAQKHLTNNCIGQGDLFIYFGWFKEIERHNGVWRFTPSSRDLHVIYGWLLVEDMISLFGKENNVLNQYPWLGRHPHLFGNKDKQNTIYLGSRTLPSELSSKITPGAGIFNNIRDMQILTDPSQKNRSCWKLPACFYPCSSKPSLSYHENIDRWKIVDKTWITLNSVGRGQEFVLNTKQYSGIKGWLRKLFR